MKKILGLVSLGLVVGITPVLADTVVGSKAVTNESYEIEEMLEYALQDEMIAQATYDEIIETFDVTRPFTNIIRAEEKHIEAVLGLYDVLGIEVPDFDPEVYVEVPDSLEEIYSTGVEAEKTNIAMFEQFLSQDLDEETEYVFTALKEASESHLQAFERQASGDYGTGVQARKGNSNGNGNVNAKGNANMNANRGENQNNQLNQENCVLN